MCAFPDGFECTPYKDLIITKTKPGEWEISDKFNNYYKSEIFIFENEEISFIDSYALFLGTSIQNNQSGSSTMACKYKFFNKNGRPIDIKLYGFFTGVEYQEWHFRNNPSKTECTGATTGACRIECDVK